MTARNRLAIAFGIVLGASASIAAPSAFAQLPLPPATVNYSFDIPLARVTPNPCTGGFTLISGTLHLAVATTAGTAYQIVAQLASSGNGMDVSPDGTPVVGAPPPYLYGSDANVSTTFPDGVPEYVEQTMPINDFLVRDSLADTNDSYTMTTSLRLIFDNGLPTVPTLDSVSVACQ